MIWFFRKHLLRVSVGVPVVTLREVLINANSALLVLNIFALLYDLHVRGQYREDG